MEWLVASATADALGTGDGPPIKSVLPAAWANEEAYSPDGQVLAVAHGIVELVDLTDFAHSRVLSGRAGMVRAVAWSPDGGLMATASDDGTARIWDAGTGRPLITLLSLPEGDSARFSPTAAVPWTAIPATSSGGRSSCAGSRPGSSTSSSRAWCDAKQATASISRCHRRPSMSAISTPDLPVKIQATHRPRTVGYGRYGPVGAVQPANGP
jgi:WD40 repeat protein